MDEGRSRASRAEWEKRVERWQDSGLTAEEFAGELGINARTLSYWKWRLKRDAHGRTSTGPSPAPRGQVRRQRRGRSEGSVEAPTGSFVEIAASTVDSRFELELGNGRRLRISPDFKAEALTRLLGVLEGGS
jgi:transposase